MQPYYAIKLKCFVLRLMMGCSLLLISAGIVVSILQEVMNSYDANSRLAYILGLLICALMVALGIVLIYQAFHFERFVFGRSQRSYDLLKKDMQDKSVVSAGNLIVTDQFMLLFSKHIFNMCKVIRLENVIACFEDPVYGTVAKPSEYTLYIYDRDFKCLTIVLDAKAALIRTFRPQVPSITPVGRLRPRLPVAALMQTTRSMWIRRLKQKLIRWSMMPERS